MAEGIQGENVFFEKNYARGSQKSSCSVTVTDRRLIHSFSYKKGSETTQINVDDIEGCELQIKKGNAFAKVLIVFGIYSLLSGIFYLLTSRTGSEMGWIGTLALGLGIALTLIGFVLNAKVSFFIAVRTQTLENPMILCNTIRGKHKIIRLKVNKEAAREIINGLFTAVCKARESR